MSVEHQVPGRTKSRPDVDFDQRSVKDRFDQAVAFERAGKLDDAIVELRRAAELDATSREIHVNLAALLEKTGRLDEALPIARRAVQLCPELPISHYNLGKVLQSGGKLDAAISAYSDAIELDASFALAYTNRGWCRLLQSDFDAGWADYEWRFRTPLVQIDRYPQPRWNGTPLPEGTLLVHGEQGVGDEIQFASCVPDLVPLVKKCVLVCHPRLAKLLARSFPGVTVVAHERKSDGLPPQIPIAIDAQIAAGSVPNYLRRSVDDFPTRERYLLADPRQKRQWRERFETLGPGLKIGISWFGGGTSEERRHRTTKLSEWRDVLAVGGAQFINLQYGNCADELQGAAAQDGVTIHQFAEADPLGDLDAFAAKVAALDLVISIGNATVHLAGALGVPTWCLVPFVPQWRWGIAGETTPWYPSVQIIRQTAGYDWTLALAETAHKLKEFTAHPRRNDPAPRSAKSKIAATAVSKPEPSKRNDSPTILVRQATQLFNENRIDEAAQIAEQILKLDSANVPAIRILGVAARKAQQFDRSLELLSRAVEIAPGSAAVHFEKGLTFAEMKQQRDAYDCFVKSTRCKPPLQPAFVNISAILEQQERYEESLQWARKAIELKSDCPLGHYNLANSLRECGRIADAIAQYELAVKYRPDYAKAKWNLGICHVLLGNFAKAWPFFELRDVAEEVKLDQFTQPRWDGTSLAGKTIVVHAEQGIGDEVLFASCFGDVIAQAGKTILVCEPRLQKLFARSFPQATVYSWTRRKDWAPMPLAEQIDCQIPAGSLPLYFRNQADDFPRRERFLSVDPALVEHWRQRLAQLGAGLKVGISWRAGGKANEGRKRTIELIDWREILSTPDVTFVNLQYGDTADDLAEVERQLGVRILDWEQGDPLVDMDSYAAKISALDLVISVGNAAVHLAGAVGTPAWTLLPRVPSWRWMVAGEDSPWYSSVKLFRQPRRRQWEPVLEQIAANLRNVAKGANALSAEKRSARIRAVQPQNEPPEAASIEPSPATNRHWLDARELGSRHPLQVIATLQEQAETAFMAKDFVEAERLYREILLITPRHLKAHSSLASIARETGRLDHAVRCFQRALSIFEPHAANHAALAETLADLGRTDEAKVHAKRALSLDASLPEAQRAMGRALQLSGHHTAAAASLTKTMKRLPGDVTTICSLSRSLTAGGQLDQALEMLHEHIANSPTEPQLHLALSEALLEDQAIDEAETSIRRAIELQPSLAAAHHQLSLLHQQRGRLPEAIAAARIAVEHGPQSVETMLHLATLLRQCDQPAEAEALYRRALALRPESVEIMNSLGSSLVEQGRAHDAIRQYEQAIELRPNYAAAHSNRGLALLELGRFAEGWDEYEWRWQSGQQSRGNWNFSQPQWDGAALTGRTILIYGEQGLGDEIMFATCYGEVIDEAARAIFLCDARLERLFRRSFPQATVLGVPQGSEHSWRLPQGVSLDVQCPAGSLPRYLRRSADAFPRQRQLLQPAAEKVDAWRQKFSHTGAGMKVGIAWRTGDAALMQSRRSTQLEAWCPILTAANVQCVNLQYGGDYRREIAEVASQTGAKIFDPPEADNQFDLDGLAAKIAALDLVITVDNTIAHLAGAVGTPTWVVLSEPANWRWLAGCEESVWYGNVRLFRAGKIQQWQEVFQRLRGELLKTTFRLDEESNRELPAPPHWSRVPARANT